MADNVNIQESPPEVQFAGVNRWLRENLFSSTCLLYTSDAADE